MAQETSQKVQEVISDLHYGGHIDTMTKKWLSKTTCPPRIPLLYTITKIHKPTLTRGPIISGCDCPTVRISSFLIDPILQPIAKAQKSYLNDTTQFINFIEEKKVPENEILVSMDVTSLYTKYSSRGRTKHRMPSIRTPFFHRIFNNNPAIRYTRLKFELANQKLATR